MYNIYCTCTCTYIYTCRTITCACVYTRTFLLTTCTCTCVLDEHMHLTLPFLHVYTHVHVHHVVNTYWGRVHLFIMLSCNVAHIQLPAYWGLGGSGSRVSCWRLQLHVPLRAVQLFFLWNKLTVLSVSIWFNSSMHMYTVYTSIPLSVKNWTPVGGICTFQSVLDAT